MLTKKIPVYSAFLSLLSGVAVTFLFLNKDHTATAKESSSVVPTNQPDKKPDNALLLSRQNGYDLINPLLSARSLSESDNLSALKARISNLIEDDKRQGTLSSASVYLCSFLHGDWICINPDELFHPGSLMKVPVMMTYFKESEKDPQVFAKKIFFEKNAGDLPTQTFAKKALEQGHSYTVKELLQYMISYSDNNATRLLNQNADLNILRKVFTDLNMAEPNLSDMNYQINARNFSEFFTVLYNASYLTKASSEYAMELLRESDFKEGLTKDIPASVKVAHKFGEWGDVRMNIHELHESGIVYLGGKPYLLTVMTKGNTSRELAAEISKISKVVFDHFSAN